MPLHSRALATLLLALTVLFPLPPGLQPTLHASDQSIYDDGHWLGHSYSWLYWWETNREQYLRRPVVSRDLQLESQRIDLRRQAIDRLGELIREGVHPRIQAAAALSLGRLEDTRHVERLIGMTRHEDDAVRRSAWMALGLIDRGQAREHIRQVLANPDLKEHDTLAWITAIALMRKPELDLLQALYKTVNQDTSAPVSQKALWALRMHHPPELIHLAREVARKTPHVALANEAILVFKHSHDPNDLQFMERAYHTRHPDNRIPEALSQAIKRHTPAVGVLVSPHQYDVSALRSAVAMTFDREDLINERTVRKMRDTLRRTYVRDQRKIPYRYDAMWYPVSHAQWGGTERRLALISLGRIGNYEDTELLIEVLRGQHTYGPPAHLRHHDPSRGYAAMALGLQMRRWRILAPEDLSPEIRRMQRRAVDALAQYAADPNMLPSIRSACMIALGLTNDKAVAPRIIESINISNDHGRLVASFGLVALAMLEDPAAAAVARGLLPSPEKQEQILTEMTPMALEEKVSVGQVLIRRNAALGLALLGDQRSLALLDRHFGREHHSSMAMIRTYKWCQDDSVVHKLLPLLRSEGDPRHATFAAWCVGELYDSSNMPRLTEVLLKDLNYTLPRQTDVYVRNIATQGGWMKKGSLWTYQYHVHANEFLFQILLAKRYLH